MSDDQKITLAIVAIVFALGVIKTIYYIIYDKGFQKGHREGRDAIKRARRKELY